MHNGEADLSAQQGDVVLGLAGGVGGVQVRADVVAGVGEEHVRHERDGARRALDVQHHASLRRASECDSDQSAQLFFLFWAPGCVALRAYMWCECDGKEIEDK